MATKIIKAWINGAIQEIEVEDIISPAQPLSVEDRLFELEDKPIITEGNLLVGNGTDEPEEMTPDEVLSHINGASVVTMTSEEYESLGDGESNANTLYVLTDSEEDVMVPPSTAKIGQTIIVKSIDENGKPIEWEAVDNIRYVASDTEPDDKSVVWIDTADSTVDYEQVVIDSTLTQSGWAADAKKTGDEIKLKADLEYVLDLENNKIPIIDSELKIAGQAADAKAAGDAINRLTSQLNRMIYIGDDEPTNIVDGMVWIDTSESQSVNNEDNEVI